MQWKGRLRERERESANVQQCLFGFYGFCQKQQQDFQGGYILSC